MKKELLVTEREYIQRLSLITGYDKDIVRDVIKAQTEFVIDELRNGIPVRLGNLGEFHLIKVVCNGGVDFSTGKRMPTKEVTVAKFKTSRALKNAVKEMDE